MTSLHLIQVPLDLRPLHEWAAIRGLPSRGGLDEGLALHHLLSETFGKGVLQPFRLMIARGARKGSLYAYASNDAATLREAAAHIAAPEIAAVLDLERLCSTPRPPIAWSAGQRLGFDLRLRPVVRLARALDAAQGSFGKGAEVDAFVVEAIRHHPQTREGMKEAARPREAVYLDWLTDRLGGAAELDRGATRLARFQRTRVHRGGKTREGPDAIFHGTLTITDPAAFADRLARGVGRHRAYGYGMLLLRPPRRC